MLPDFYASFVLNYLQNPTPDDGVRVALDLLLHKDDTPLLIIYPKHTLDPTRNETTPLNMHRSLHGGVFHDLVPQNSLPKPILVEQKTTQVSTLCSNNMATHRPALPRHQQKWRYLESSEAHLV